METEYFLPTAKTAHLLHSLHPLATMKTALSLPTMKTAYSLPTTEYEDCVFITYYKACASITYYKVKNVVALGNTAAYLEGVRSSDFHLLIFEKISFVTLAPIYHRKSSLSLFQEMLRSKNGNGIWRGQSQQWRYPLCG
jgi:hypothetical protein